MSEAATERTPLIDGLEGGDGKSRRAAAAAAGGGGGGGGFGWVGVFSVVVVVVSVLGVVGWVVTGGLNGSAVAHAPGSTVGALVLGQFGGVPSVADAAAAAAAATQPQTPPPTKKKLFPFHSATPKYAVASVDPEGNDVTLPWQPLCLGTGAGAAANASGAASPPRHALGVVAGHGLHCDMRSVPWLLVGLSQVEESSLVNPWLETAWFQSINPSL
jgi:hypothetical protein